MKNGKVTYYLLFLLVVLCVNISCRARKNIVREDVSQKTTTTTVSATDTSRVISKTQSDMEETVSIFETTTRETVHLDDSGRVRSVVKESISKETGQRRTDRGSGSVVSITGKSDSVSVVETSQTSSNEKTDIKTDSRPVQGVEWFWVIFGILITAVLIYVLLKKL